MLCLKTAGRVCVCRCAHRCRVITPWGRPVRPNMGTRLQLYLIKSGHFRATGCVLFHSPAWSQMCCQHPTTPKRRISSWIGQFARSRRRQNHRFCAQFAHMAARCCASLSACCLLLTLGNASALALSRPKADCLNPPMTTFSTFSFFPTEFQIRSARPVTTSKDQLTSTVGVLGALMPFSGE